jgi:hypothetical protein
MLMAVWSAQGGRGLRDQGEATGHCRVQLGWLVTERQLSHAIPAWPFLPGVHVPCVPCVPALYQGCTCISGPCKLRLHPRWLSTEDRQLAEQHVDSLPPGPL